MLNNDGKAITLAIGLLLSTWASLATSANNFQVITHPHNSLQSLNQTDLQLIFSLHKSYWPDGSPILLVVLPSTDKTHVDFVRTVLRMQPHQLERNWNRLIYTGRAPKPKEVSTIEEMKETVLKTAGTIGYLPQSKDTDHVHVISVE